METNAEVYEKFEAIIDERGVGYRGVFDRYNMNVGEKKEIGSARLTAFKISKEDAVMYNTRHFIRGDYQMMVKAGKYVRLHIDGTLYMSDTYMEYITNLDFIEHAHGSVLIAGLGIGLILHNIQEKLSNGTISSVTIIENNADVIKLIKPYFLDHRIKIVHGDIFKYSPKGKESFDTIYFDIWESISSDNLKEMAMLRAFFSKHLSVTPTAWMGCWEEERCNTMRH